MNRHLFAKLGLLSLVFFGASACVQGYTLREHRVFLVEELPELWEPALRCEFEREIALAEANSDFALYAMQHGRFLAARAHTLEARAHLEFLREELDPRPECWTDFVEVPPAPPCSPDNLEVDCSHPNCAEHAQCGPCTAFNPEVVCDHPNCAGNPGCAPCGQYTDVVDCAEPSCFDDERCAPCTAYSGVIDCEHPNCAGREACAPCTDLNPAVDCSHPNCSMNPACFEVVVEDTLVVVTDDRIEITEQINFETGSANISGRRSFAILDDVVGVLEQFPDMQIRIEGHTDNVGRAEFNRRLSQSRAESVRSYIISRGIDASRLVAVGYGQDRPIDDNTTESGRAANRRVEFHILRR